MTPESALTEAVQSVIKARIASIEKKLKTALAQRDNWRQKARHYKSKLLERASTGGKS